MTRLPPPSARSARLSLLTLLVALLWAGLAQAAPEATPAAPGGGLPSPVPGSEFSWWGYVRALGAMFLVLGALWAGIWLLRRSGRFAGMPRADSLPRDSLYLERQLSLGPRKGLMVVRFLNKRLLLGVTEHQITLLTETDLHDRQTSSDAATFQRYLDNANRPSGPESAPAGPDAD